MAKTRGTKALTLREIKDRRNKKIYKSGHAVELVLFIDKAYASSVGDVKIRAWIDILEEKFIDFLYEKGSLNWMVEQDVKQYLINHAKLGTNYFPKIFKVLYVRDYGRNQTYKLTRGAFKNG